MTLEDQKRELLNKLIGIIEKGQEHLPPLLESAVQHFYLENLVGLFAPLVLLALLASAIYLLWRRLKR